VANVHGAAGAAGEQHSAARWPLAGTCHRRPGHKIPKQGMPRGAERTTWLGRGPTGAIGANGPPLRTPTGLAAATPSPSPSPPPPLPLYPGKQVMRLQQCRCHK
jgi:hypothetical protein